MKKLFVGLIVSSFLVGLAGMADASLISNGSFELGTLTPGTSTGADADIMFLNVGAGNLGLWSVVGNNVGWVGASNLIIGGTAMIPASLGDRYLLLTGNHNTAGSGVQQSIATTAGQEYRLSFDLGTSKRGTPTLGGILASAGATSGMFSRDAGGDTVDFDWGSHSLLFTATESSTLISLTGGVETNYTSLDNVSVSAVPVPSSIILMGTGLIGLVGFGYRRKKQTT